MTELEKIGYTKEFIDKLANGINPLDDSPIPEGDIMNNVRLSRCMFYVSDILRQVIEHGGVEKTGKKRERKPRKDTSGIPFSISYEQLQKYEFSPHISTTALAKRIYELAGNSEMKKITYKPIVEWLTSRGLLRDMSAGDGKTKKVPTDEGWSIGIRLHRRDGDSQVEYLVYNENAQRFILENFSAIVAFNEKTGGGE